MHLYKISFIGTDKVYIGMTTKNAEFRLKQHANSKRKSLINLAIKKYGNPVLTVIGSCDDLDLLRLAEQEAIEKFNSKYPNGYNLTDGGEGVFGFKWSDEQKKKKSNSIRAYIKNNPSFSSDISDRQLKRFSDNTDLRNDISKHFRKYFSFIENREKRSELSINQFKSPENRKKISEGVKRYYQDNPEKAQERTNRLVLYIKNNPEKHSIAMVERSRARPELAENHSKTMTAYFSIKENREKASERTKKSYIDNPSLSKESSIRMKNRFSDPINLARHSAAIATYQAKKSGRLFLYVYGYGEKN